MTDKIARKNICKTKTRDRTSPTPTPAHTFHDIPATHNETAQKNTHLKKIDECKKNACLENANRQYGTNKN